MIILAFILITAGVWLLNSEGSYTSNNTLRAAGWALNVMALVIFAIIYGTARGTFVYLGVLAFIGMGMTLALPYIKKQKA